jgi:hypothetical protein
MLNKKTTPVDHKPFIFLVSLLNPTGLLGTGLVYLGLPWTKRTACLLSVVAYSTSAGQSIRYPVHPEKTQERGKTAFDLGGKVPSFSYPQSRIFSYSSSLLIKRHFPDELAP